jgi:excisionase family DNA binding protein
MLNVEIRLVISGREVPLDSFTEAFMADVRRAVREEIDRAQHLTPVKNLAVTEQHEHKAQPLVVPKREAARLLGVSLRTVDNYIGLKVIRSVRLGRRVLVPMSSVRNVASKGVSRWRRVIE